jgi:NitT/TauT family transport system substrate-binding protein
MKRLTAVLLALLLCLTAFAGCAQSEAEPESTPASSETSVEESAEEVSEESVSSESSSEEVKVTTEPATYNVASLKGPTTMGMVKLMQDAEAKTTFNTYNVTMYGAADEITAGIANGTIDIANVPCNLAAVLYNKTQGAISVAAVNTLGVLYVVETGETIQSFEDLKGKTIYSTGKGTTPEFALNYLLNENGIDPEKDVTIEYKSEATEVAAMLAQSENAVAVLPQPFVTTAMMQNEKLRIALSFTEEWDSLQGKNGSTLVTGVTIVRNEVVENNPQAFAEFLKEYEASIAYTESNPNETAALIAQYGIVPKEPIALKALPYCNLKFLKGEEMEDKVSGYLEVLFDADPKSVGGKLPDDAFYYAE